MEESKYYIPELSEFHVGFSYEFKNHRTKDIWTKAKLYNHEELVFLGESYMNTEFRVPFLSKEDIESLGWKQGNNNHYYMEIDEESGWSMEYYEHENKYGICNTGECWFWGTIKNKQELKKLMQQIGINEK